MKHLGSIKIFIYAFKYWRLHGCLAFTLWAWIHERKLSQHKHLQEVIWAGMVGPHHIRGIARKVMTGVKMGLSIYCGDRDFTKFFPNIRLFNFLMAFCRKCVTLEFISLLHAMHLRCNLAASSVVGDGIKFCCCQLYPCPHPHQRTPCLVISLPLHWEGSYWARGSGCFYKLC